MKKAVWSSLATCCLFFAPLQAATIYTLEITSGVSYYFETSTFERIESELTGTFVISITDDGQQLTYLDQNVVADGSPGAPEYTNGSCPYQNTLDCKTLTYRPAEMDYYYVYLGDIIETRILWRESVTFDGVLMTIEATSNNGGDTPVYFEMSARVVPVPAAVWLLGSAVLGLAASAAVRPSRG